MVGRCRSHLAEEAAAIGECAEEGREVADGEPTAALEKRDLLCPLRARDAEGGIRAEGRDHLPLPARAADRGVMLERVACLVGRREQLDVEAIEQRARAEFRARQLLGDRVIDRLARLAGELLPD